MPLCIALTAVWARDIPLRFDSGLSLQPGRCHAATPGRSQQQQLLQEQRLLLWQVLPQHFWAEASSCCRGSACYNGSWRSPGRRVPAGGACAACPPGTMGVLRAGGAAISLSRPAHPFTAKNP